MDSFVLLKIQEILKGQGFRKRYLIIAFLILNDGITGLAAIMTGGRRIFIELTGNDGTYMSNKLCLFNVCLISP